MRIKLKTTSSRATPDMADKYESIGFKFSAPEKSKYDARWFCHQLDYTPEIEIQTMEDLMGFAKEWGPIVIDAEDNSIEIYDDYRE